MSPMHKQQLRWPILRILRRLFIPNPRQIPNNNPPIIPRTRENGFLIRRPRHRGDLVPMTFKRMQLEFQVSQVP